MIKFYYLHEVGKSCQQFEYLVSSDTELKTIIIDDKLFAAHESTENDSFVPDPYADFTDIDIVNKADKGICGKGKAINDNELEMIQTNNPNILFVWKMINT